MTDIAGVPVSALAPSALLGLTVLMILTGRLMPRRAYDDKVREAEKWQETADELNAQNQAMLRAFGPTLTDFLQGLRRAGVGTRDGGEDS